MSMLVFVPLFVVAAAQANSAHALDFWVGNWSMDSSQPNDPKSKGAWQEKLCKNRIAKVYGGKVIQESFSMPGFTGGSWSSYDPVKMIWRQTWVDDAGSYLLFEGGMNGSEFVLKQTNAGKVHARMRFANITKDSFDWLWEKSSDGKDWTLDWHLKYRRDKLK